jgi:hypothetical protein
MYLIPVVIKVAQEESLDPIVLILQAALPRSLTNRSEIGFHGWGTRIQDTDDIGVFGPLVSEDLLEMLGKPLKGPAVFGLG